MTLRTPFLIRRLQEDDLDQVMAASFWSMLRQGNQRHWALGLIESDRCVCQGLFYDNELRAFVLSELCAGDNGLIWAVWTHEDSRGKGVATFLVNDVEMILRTMGAVDVMAFCNAKSAPVMARLGYHSYDSYTEMLKDL